jgi:hypothetical protein
LEPDERKDKEKNMIRDANLTFSDEQAITGAAISTNIIDLSAVRDVGTSPRPLYLYSYVTTTFSDSGNNSNCTVILQTDSVEAFNSATNSFTVGVFATNSAAGTKLGPIVVSPTQANEPYLGVYYDVGGGNFTNAAVTTFLSYDPHVWSAYPDNVTISLP